MIAEGSAAEVVDRHLYLVKLIARKIANTLPASVEIDDLIQWGSLGLMDAIEKWDPTRKNKFKTYAEWRIRGAMLDGIRSLDFVGRSIRDLAKRIEAADRELTGEFSGRRPKSEELAERLGITLEELHEARDRAQPCNVISLEGDLFTADDRRALLVSAQNRSADLVEKINAMQKLERIVAKAEATNRACFILHFVWGMSLDEIADVFGCSFSRISQRIQKVQKDYRG